jgi:uncharacterized membrane protein YkoI
MTNSGGEVKAKKTGAKRKEVNMRRILTLGIAVGTIIIAGLAFTSGCSHPGEKSTDVVITMNELPSTVKPLAEKEVDGCKIKEVEKETKDGKTIYAITYYDKDGTLMEIEYAENGKLISNGKE